VGGREKPGKSREKSGKSQEKSGTLRRLLSPAKFTSVLPGYRESGLEHELALSFYVRKRFPSPLIQFIRRSRLENWARDNRGLLENVNSAGAELPFDFFRGGFWLLSFSSGNFNYSLLTERLAAVIYTLICTRTSLSSNDK
jgi:hypothetical protein